LGDNHCRLCGGGNAQAHRQYIYIVLGVFGGATLAAIGYFSLNPSRKYMRLNPRACLHH
jgi:hypothetical protein